jgi:hypothetical protein
MFITGRRIHGIQINKPAVVLRITARIYARIIIRRRALESCIRGFWRGRIEGRIYVKSTVVRGTLFNTGRGE